MGPAGATTWRKLRPNDLKLAWFRTTDTDFDYGQMPGVVVTIVMPNMLPLHQSQTWDTLTSGEDEHLIRRKAIEVCTKGIIEHVCKECEIEVLTGNVRKRITDDDI